MALALDLQNLSKVELGVGALSAQGNNPLLPNDQRNIDKNPTVAATSPISFRSIGNPRQ